MHPDVPEKVPRVAQWPSLNFDEWKDSCATLHMWTQIVGKIRLARTPWVNHSWHVPLYVTARGLTTSPISCDAGAFQIDFDFIEHKLSIQSSDGAADAISLHPYPVADFYAELMAKLDALGLGTKIHMMPNEVINAIPFDQDRIHAAYDAEYANRFWRVLVQVDRLFKQFRARYIGKCSPVHFFWGSFDLAVTRFSGRLAPEHPGGIPHLPDRVAREAYSHEVSSCGFWPGSEARPYPVFYTYAYPEPAGFSATPLIHGKAKYDTTFREFVLPYEEVRQAKSPDAILLEFLQGSYEAAASLGGWDRPALERADSC